MRDYEEKQMRLTAEVEKKEKEISRTKEELRAQSEKTRQKISNRDTGYDLREEKKIANHNSLVQDLKQRIETVCLLWIDAFCLFWLLIMFILICFVCW